MAVDTARKRKSMLKRSNGPVPMLVFAPSGTVDEQARATMLMLYGGNALDAPTADVASAFNIRQPTGVSIVKKMAFEITDIRHDSP